MAHGTGGLDPRITAPAALSQTQAARREKGIPLIADAEAERRQRAADVARRRRRVLRRVLLVLVALASLAVAVWLLAQVLVLQLS